MTGKSNLTKLEDDQLEEATGGAGASHELAHVVQQNQAAQFNPKELTVDKSVPWKPNGG